MRIAYIHTLPHRVGSAYKYFDFMQHHFRGEIVAGVDGVAYDLAIVRGDRHKDWTIPLQAGIPYILIEHDSASMREGSILGFERKRMACARAAIFTCESVRDYYRNIHYPLPYHEVIHLRPLRQDIVVDPLPKLPSKHLVYCGGVVSWESRKRRFGYRAYHAIFAAFVDAGWTVHFYPTQPYLYEDYKEVGCVSHKPLPYSEMLREISQYTAGFVGYNSVDVPEVAFRYSQICRPNKTWDYLAAGIPTIGYQCGTTGDIFAGRWGVVVHDLHKQTLNNIQLPHVYESDRHEQVMDNDLPLFERVLAHAVDAY